MKKAFSFFLENEAYDLLLKKLEETGSTRETFENISNLIISNELLLSNNNVVSIETKIPIKTCPSSSIPIRELIDESTLVSKSVKVPSFWVVNNNLMLVRSLLELTDGLYPSNFKLAKQAFKLEVDGKENQKKEYLLDILSHEVLCSIQLM